MKKILKKVFCGVLSAVMAFTMCISSSAADEEIKYIDSGKKISFQMESKGDYYNYKVELSKKGALSLKISASAELFYVMLLNENGEYMPDPEFEEEKGDCVFNPFTGAVFCSWDDGTESFKSTLKWNNLPKGTYCVKLISEYGHQIKGKTSISFSYPQEEKKEEAAKAELTGFTITLKKGDTLQLGALMDGEGIVKWSTSKKSVASVTSKGKVTAKGKGTATITAKCGDSKIKIKIKVTE